MPQFTITACPSTDEGTTPKAYSQQAGDYHEALRLFAESHPGLAVKDVQPRLEKCHYMPLYAPLDEVKLFLGLISPIDGQPGIVLAGMSADSPNDGELWEQGLTAWVVPQEPLEISIQGDSYSTLIRVPVEFYQGKKSKGKNVWTMDVQAGLLLASLTGAEVKGDLASCCFQLIRGREFWDHQAYPDLVTSLAAKAISERLWLPQKIRLNTYTYVYVDDRGAYVEAEDLSSGAMFPNSIMAMAMKDSRAWLTAEQFQELIACGVGL